MKSCSGYVYKLVEIEEGMDYLKDRARVAGLNLRFVNKKKRREKFNCL